VGVAELARSGVVKGNGGVRCQGVGKMPSPGLSQRERGAYISLSTFSMYLMLSLARR